jgi:hypothetical protein
VFPFYDRAFLGNAIQARAKAEGGTWNHERALWREIEPRIALTATLLEALG